MKTTMELPDELYVRAKATALQRRMTMKALFTRALERELKGGDAANRPARFQMDEEGWPVLVRERDSGSVIRDDQIDRLREEEGV